MSTTKVSSAIVIGPASDQNSEVIAPSDQPSKTPWSTLLLLFLFVASGCASLVYEIIWFQMLELVIGSSAVSLGVLLGTFMGGMCLGSVVIPRVLTFRSHPLWVWAGLEAAVGGLGILVLFWMPYLAELYVDTALGGPPGLLLRGLLCGSCLLLPTMLMGATLPAMSRYLATIPGGLGHLGLFYAGNLGGAVLGSLLTAFWLLRVYDVAVATYAAAALNALIALEAALIAWEIPRWRPVLVPEIPTEASRTRGRIYLVIGLSGFCALAAEVVWTRLLALMLGPTVYAFGIILAVFLGGLGIGSAVSAVLVRRKLCPAILLAGCQWLQALAIAWAAWMLANSLPYWPVKPELSKSIWFNLQLDLVRCLWSILPATCLWGASFPLALAAATEPGQDPGHLVGKVYGANTLGAIAGALACSLLLIPWLGSQNVQRLLIGLSGLAGLLAIAPSSERFAIALPYGISLGRREPRRCFGIGLLGAGGLLLVLVLIIPKVPWGLLAYGYHLPTMSYMGRLLYAGEGINASVSVSEINDGTRLFHVSGKVEASTAPRDMCLQRMLGQVPALFHPEPRSVLVVGCGAGVTAGSFVVHPGIERIVICEIEPLIPKVVAHYFEEVNHEVLQDPRVTLVYEDARHFILTSREKFDIITSDPIHPWVKGAATLYTKEYFQLCKEHLNPGGFLTQWVPLYESNSRAVKTTMATFFEVFPEGTIWSNDDMGAGYDLVLLGQVGPLQINIDELQRRLHAPQFRSFEQSLNEVGIKSVIGLLSTYGGRAADLAPWLVGAELNRDANLRLQYLAGLLSGVESADDIYDQLLSYRQFPTEMFRGSSLQIRALAKKLEPPSAPK